MVFLSLSPLGFFSLLGTSKYQHTALSFADAFVILSGENYLLACTVGSVVYYKRDKWADKSAMLAVLCSIPNDPSSGVFVVGVGLQQGITDGTFEALQKHESLPVERDMDGAIKV